MKRYTPRDLDWMEEDNETGLFIYHEDHLKIAEENYLEGLKHASDIHKGIYDKAMEEQRKLLERIYEDLKMRGEDGVVNISNNVWMAICDSLEDKQLYRFGQSSSETSDPDGVFSIEDKDND